MEQVLKKEKQIQAKPIMKWAGGKTQMLGDIMPKIPQKYGKYIEPFIGGGALFFALSPDKAIVADSNPELINMYRQVADNVEAVISYLKKYKNTKEDFYEVRSLDWFKLKKEEAAARTIYLNKTCFNGLYRVNKKGQFNVPFGKYKAPNFCDEEAIRCIRCAEKSNYNMWRLFVSIERICRTGRFYLFRSPVLADFRIFGF